METQCIVRRRGELIRLPRRIPRLPLTVVEPWPDEPVSFRAESALQKLQRLAKARFCPLKPFGRLLTALPDPQLSFEMCPLEPCARGMAGQRFGKPGGPRSAPPPGQRQVQRRRRAAKTVRQLRPQFDSANPRPEGPADGALIVLEPAVEEVARKYGGAVRHPHFRRPAAAAVRFLSGGRSESERRLPGTRLERIFVRGREITLGVDLKSCRPFRLPLRAPCPASAAVLRRNVPAPFRRPSPFRQGDGTLFPNAVRPYASRTVPRFLNGVSSGSRPEAQSPSGASEDRSSAITATQPRTLPQIPTEFGAPVSPPFGAAERTGTVPSASNV